MWGKWQKAQTKLYNSIEKDKKDGTVSILLSHIKEMRAKFVIHSIVKTSLSSVLSLIFNWRFKKTIQKYILKLLFKLTGQKIMLEFAKKIPNSSFWSKSNFYFNICHLHRQIKSLAIVSDSNDSTKLSVIANITKIIELLSDDATEIHVFSDNATS